MPSLSSDRLLARSGLAIITGVALIVAIGFYSANLKSSINKTQQSWSDFSERAAAVTVHLSDLNRAIGYGGFIHNLKNYVLRGDDAYATRASQNLADARDTLVELEAALNANATTSGSVGELWAIRETLSTYRDKFNEALRAPKDIPVKELDALVKVDDGPALTAMNDLARRVKAEFDERRAASETHIAEINLKINIGLGIVVLVLLATIGAIWLLRRLEHAKEDIAKSKAQIDLLIDQAPDALLFVDADGAIRRVNREASALFEYTQQELLDMRVEDLMPPEAREEHVHKRARMQESTERRMMSEGTELQALTKSGKLKYVEISLNPTTFNGEALTIAAVRDVSKQRSVSHALAEARAHAENASDMKSAFLANMSHEIRTPLTGLLGMADLLEMTSLDEKQTKFMNTLRQSGRHLETVLNDILDLSKLEADQMKMNIEPFAISQLIDTVQSVYGAVAGAKKIDLNFHIAEDFEGLEIYGDVIRLRQVVMNLVGNAVKFTKYGSVDVAISLTRNRTRGIDTLHIAVRDTGVGIETDAIDEIFDPFVQAASQRTMVTGGTGLGLSICKRLIDRMDGAISVTSTLGEGSVFSVSVPLKTAKVPAKPKPAADGTPALRLVEPADLRILAADDNEINRQIVETMMTRWGYKIDIAKDGVDALAQITANDYDLIFLDIHMPNMDGNEALKRAREAGRIKGKVFAFTADVMKESVDQYRMMGFDGYVSKPIDWDRVQDLIKGDIAPDTQTHAIGLFGKGGSIRSKSDPAT